MPIRTEGIPLLVAVMRREVEDDPTSSGVTDLIDQVNDMLAGDPPVMIHESNPLIPVPVTPNEATEDDLDMTFGKTPVYSIANTTRILRSMDFFNALLHIRPPSAR